MTKFVMAEGVDNVDFEDFGPRKTRFSSAMGFSPSVLAKEDIEGMKGNEGSLRSCRLSSVGISFLGLYKLGKGLPSEGTVGPSYSSIPFISSSSLCWSLSSTSGPLLSQPNSWKESQMDCGGVVFNSMVGIPITEGVEFFEEASNHLLKKDSSLGRLNSNLEGHDVSKIVFIQDLDSLILEGFQVHGLSSPEKDKVQ